MAGSGTRQLLSADGQSTTLRVVGDTRLNLSGDFGTGTAKVQAQDPSGAFVDIAGASFTAATDTLLNFPDDAVNFVQVDLSGSSSPALNAIPRRCIAVSNNYCSIDCLCVRL